MYKRILLAAAACVALAACNKEVSNVTPESEAQMGTMTFEVIPEQSMDTKAVSAYTTAQTYESQVNKIQVLVFDASGNINFYKDLGTSTSGSISTTAGAKTVWAVVNGPNLAGIGTLTALQNTALQLNANSTTASTGFVMSGSASCTVTAGSAVSCGITVSRIAARVALVNVTNSLPASYGAVTIERVFLANVVGNQNIAGNAAASTWYNKEGRADESTRNATHIIDGSTYKASIPDLTYKAVSQSVANGSSHAPSTPYLFYTYANSSTTAPTGFNATFAPQRSVLVIVATVNGSLNYYPIVLDDSVINRNTAYTVSANITGLGSADPDKPVSKGSINATITVSGWASGTVYEETI